jgi:cytochrome c5
MRRRASIAALIVAASAGVAAAVASIGCAGAIPHPTEAHVLRASSRWPGSSRETLEDGRTLYVRRCSGCHTLYTPSSHRRDEWRAIVAEMATRSKLEPHESELVARYLETMSDD